MNSVANLTDEQAEAVRARFKAAQEQTPDPSLMITYASGLQLIFQPAFLEHSEEFRGVWMHLMALRAEGVVGATFQLPKIGTAVCELVKGREVRE